MDTREFLLMPKETWWRVRSILTAVTWSVTALVVWDQAFAQQSEYRGRIGQEGCQSISKRSGELGCWIMINATLGKLPPRSMFWH